MYKGQNFSKALPSESVPGLHHEPVGRAYNSRLPLAFYNNFVTVFREINNLCSKTDISKTAWIDLWEVKMTHAHNSGSLQFFCLFVLCFLFFQFCSMKRAGM